MRALLLGISVAILAGACAGPREPGLGEGIVITKPPTGGEGLSSEERTRIEDRLREVQVLMVRQQWGGALSIVDELLSVELPDDLRMRCQALRLDIRRRQHEERPVEGRLRGDRDLYAFGDDILLTIEIENVAEVDVEIPLEDEGATGYVMLRIVRREYDVYGNVREESEQGRIGLPGSAKIDPGDTRRAVRAIPTGERRHDGFTIVEISGHVRPSVIRTDEREDYRSIPLEPIEIRVLPQNWEPLAEDPLDSLRKALTKRAPVHLLVAAELLSTGNRRAATGALIEALRGGAGTMARPIMAALRRLTGEPLPLEPARWIAWYDRT